MFIKRTPVRSVDSIPKLKKKLWKVFSLYIRRRDILRGCISCDKYIGSVSEGDAGHYYSRGACPQPSMYFSEKNVNLQCKSCNGFKEGNKQGYREGLIKKYGAKVLEDLKLKKSIKQNPWTHFEYEVLIMHYQKLTK